MARFQFPVVAYSYVTVVRHFGIVSSSSMACWRPPKQSVFPSFVTRLSLVFGRRQRQVSELGDRAVSASRTRRSSMPSRPRWRSRSRMPSALRAVLARTAVQSTPRGVRATSSSRRMSVTYIVGTGAELATPPHQQIQCGVGDLADNLGRANPQRRRLFTDEHLVLPSCRRVAQPQLRGHCYGRLWCGKQASSLPDGVAGEKSDPKLQPIGSRGCRQVHPGRTRPRVLVKTGG